MALERLEIQVDAMSVALISSAVSMRIGGVIDLVVPSNAAKLIQNSARQVSECKMIGGLCWFCLIGVVSLGVESVVRTDWLSAMAEIRTNEVVGAAIFDLRRWVHTSVLALIAAHSSFLSSVRPLFWISAVLVHCWSFFKGGRRAVMVGLLRTVSANGLNYVVMSIPQSGPIVLEMLRKVSPTLLSERLPLMAVVPKGIEKMVGSLTNLKVSMFAQSAGK